MKCTVVYYSQTGNTKEIAQSIAKGVQREGAECSLIRLKEVTYEMLADADLIGFGTPVWGSCPTLNLVDLVEKMPAQLSGRHVFYFCTHGMTPGRAVLRAINLMYQKGLKVLGWNDWYGSASLPGHLKPWFTDGHPDDTDLLEAESFGAAMVRHSRALADGDESILPAPLTEEVCDYIYGIGHPFLFGENAPEMPDQPEDLPHLSGPEHYPPLKYPTTMAYSMALEGMEGEDINATAPPIHINADLCINCGRCVEACFCDNIDGSTAPPTILNPYCEHDGFCEGVCPTGAMVFPFRPAPVSEEASRNEPGLCRYRQILNDAESLGRFRRLLPEEEVGWTTPWELVTGHPRHKEIP